MSERAYERHRCHFDTLDDEGHGLEWLPMAGDGRINGPIGAEPEVAWLSSDVFFDGLLDRFFEAVEGTPRLRWLQSAASGVDLEPYGRLLDRGVRLCNAHPTAIPIAEYVLRSVLDIFQDAGRWRAAQAEGRWEHHDFKEVWRTRWMVIGMGAIGTETARRARAFEAHVTGVRRYPTGDEPVDALISPAEVTVALPAADVVVLAAPATPETENLVGEGFLATMKPGAVLVNVARGKLVDDDALLRHLDRGHLSAAILDVFNTEPLDPDHPYWTHPRVVLTPHSSGGGTGRWDRGAELFCENLRRLLAGEPLLNEVTATQLPATDLPFTLGQHPR
ncbi:D-2-hydroxyacid dehydrogenase [Candidatus Poriferisocius sp.]|uniref:D-2-hydroxyacid dehydrogenase n=1 Tax=Candidatus Poriferisocius sp. TaxID=3101276 RepID=UPI003B022F65